MVVILFRGGKGAPRVLARAEADEFVGQLVLAGRILANAASNFPLRKEGTGGTIQMGEDIIEVEPLDVAIEINFDPDPEVSDVLGAEPTDDQLYVASVTLDETARFHMRQGLILQTQQAQQQQRQAQDMKRGLAVVKNVSERDLQ
jgi:hypothetical protein